MDYIWLSVFFGVIGSVAALGFFFRYKAAQDMRVFQALLDDALNTPGHGLILFDANGAMRFSNRQARGYLPEIVDGALNQADYKSFVNHLFDRAVDADHALTQTLEKAGQRTPFEGFREVFRCTNNPDRLCMGEMIETPQGAHVLVLTDISQHKKSEDQRLNLTLKNKTLANAIEDSAIGIVVTNPNAPGHPIVYVNGVFSTYMGMNNGSVIGKSVYEAIKRSPFDEVALDAVHKAFEAQNADNIEINYKDEGGEERWLRFKVRPSGGEGAEAGSVLGILSDITEFKKKELQLAQSQKLDALGQMAAGVAHDFNNVLSIIDGYARIGQKACAPEDRGYEYFKKIVQASTRGASLTKQMLTFGRHKIIQQDVVNVGKFLSEQMHMFQAAVTTVVDIDVKVEDDALCIDCSQDDVTQIFMNLIINAADAMPKGGRISIEAKTLAKVEFPDIAADEIEAEECVVITVEDEGQGIPSDVMMKIFDPFFTTKDINKGTGLGLSLVYGLVNQMDGVIDVESTLRKGTKFTLYIPRSESEAVKEIRGSVEDIGSLSFQGYTMMVVDDEEDLRFIMADIFEDMGFNVISAEGGNDALAKQEEYLGKIDLLLTDVMMPGLDGVRFAKLFKALRPETPIVFMSGYPESGKKAAVGAPEGSLSFTKPVDFVELTEMIFSILNKDHPNHSQMLSSSRWDMEDPPVKQARKG